MGLDVLCDGRRAFLNCTRDTLIKGLVTLLPSTSTVVEILETVPSDPEVMTACQSLKQQGYMIALDDYVAGDRRAPLAEMADIIKVDLQLTTEPQRQELIKQFGPWRCRMLAEKVDTQAEFVQAQDQGFVYFQGYFFRRPEMMGYPRHPGEPAELCAHAAGSIASATAFAGAREADQGRSLYLLPAIALSEFRSVWLPQRNPLRAARAVAARANAISGDGCG
jgi:EAL domain